MSDSCEGVVSLCWAVPFGDAGRRERALHGWTVAITDVRTGASITTATDVEIHAPVNGIVTADLTLFTGEDGRPLGESEKPCYGEDGELRTGVFRFIVAEVQTAIPAVAGA